MDAGLANTFYYVVAVTDERARTNQFTEPMPEEQFADLRVVQGVHERERASGDEADDANRQVVFCLGTMAMWFRARKRTRSVSQELSALPRTCCIDPEREGIQETLSVVPGYMLDRRKAPRRR